MLSRESSSSAICCRRLWPGRSSGGMRSIAVLGAAIISLKSMNNAVIFRTSLKDRRFDLAFHLYQTKLELIEGDATQPPADGLILPANDHLWMGTGPGRKIKETGGEEIEKAAVREGPVDMGGVVVTPAGSLPFRHILHTAVMSQDLHLKSDVLGRGLTNALERAAQMELAEVNFVLPLETGDRPLRPEILADLVGTLFVALEEMPQIRTLRLVADNAATRQVLHDAFLHRLYA
ncbi:MAG: hypothetical protein GF355_11780 [Candidatus Eisenbacteria bacterium]|nr:hypothetical protein [Candidatus Eisenbacteria bacterium]